MKASVLFLVVALAIPEKDYAQTKIDKTVPMSSGQIIQMSFDYPELIKISTWDRNEISITGTASINGGENDDAFVIENSVSGNTVKLKSFIRDMKNLPQRITITRGGQKIMFRDKAEWRKYQSEQGTGYENMSWGPDIDIELEIKVPRNTQTILNATYGMVEVRNFSGPLRVDATYGGVDVAISERSVGELVAETNFGQIYTNLDIKFGNAQVKNEDFYTGVTARPGNGPNYSFESKYGNVYLRKSSAN